MNYIFSQIIAHIQVIIGDDDVYMVVVIRVSSMLQRIQAHKDKLFKVKVIIGNFQKNSGVLLTSEHSSIELDYEVKVQLTRYNIDYIFYFILRIFILRIYTKYKYNK